MTLTLPRSDDPRVSLIIPCSVRTDLLVNCLRSLARSGPSQIPYETIVVLNGTNAGVERELRAATSGVDFAYSPVNLGVAGAGNLARSHARGAYLLLLHDDAEALPGWMEALVEAADAHPHAGAVGGKVLFPDGRLQSAGGILWREALTSTRWPGGWAGDPPPASAFDRLEFVDYCGTASLLVRASAWDAAGGLDEELYPAYFVDVDLCMALRRSGYAVLFEPRSQIHHHRAASTRSRFRDFVANRNRQYFRPKWAGALEAHEPFEQDSPASIARAIARAQAFGMSRATGALLAGQEPQPFDAARCQDEHRARAESVHRAFVAHLEAIADEAETERQRLSEALAKLSHENEELVHARHALWREKEELTETYQNVWQEKQELGLTYKTLWDEKQTLEQAHAELSQQHLDTATALGVARQAHHELEQARAILLRDKDVLEQAHAELSHRQRETERASSLLRRDHDALLHSKSWRMTAPLRAAAALLRKLRR